jgi:hypothetical protein
MRPVTIFLFLLAFIFFLAAAAIDGGLITAGHGGWLVPGGLAAIVLAWLLGMLPDRAERA